MCSRYLNQIPVISSVYRTDNDHVAPRSDTWPPGRRRAAQRADVTGQQGPSHQGRTGSFTGEAVGRSEAKTHAPCVFVSMTGL